MRLGEIVIKKWFCILAFIGSSCFNSADDKNMTDMQQLQMQFDALYFDREYFRNDQNFEKLRHVLLHLMKTTGKISAYCEIQEHGNQGNRDELLDAALPDLYIYALQIANIFDIDLVSKYQQRLAFLAERNKK